MKRKELIKRDLLPLYMAEKDEQATEKEKEINKFIARKYYLIRCIKKFVNSVNCHKDIICLLPQTALTAKQVHYLGELSSKYSFKLQYVAFDDSSLQ